MDLEDFHPITNKEPLLLGNIYISIPYIDYRNEKKFIKN